MIKSPRSEFHRADRRLVPLCSALVAVQRLRGVLNCESQLAHSLGKIACLILKLSSKRIAPENLVAGAGRQQSVDAAERALNFHKLVAIIPEKGPIEVSVEFIEIDRSWLPGRGRAQHYRVPGHCEQRLAVIVPRRIHHSERARLLPV